MEKFVKFQTHDYMDMYPSDYVRTFIADDLGGIKLEAIKYAQHMNRNYSGGTTKFICVMDAQEAKSFIDGEITKEKENWAPDSQEWIDRITNLYNKCYGEA